MSNRYYFLSSILFLVAVGGLGQVSAEEPAAQDNPDRSVTVTPIDTDGEGEPSKPAESSDYSETVIVTASRTPVSSDDIGSSVTLIDRDEIEQRQSLFVADLLRGVPGLSVSRAGSIGSFTQVRVRGAEANQVLVLIDGVAVNDVFVGDEIPLELLTSQGIDRIEVVRGPQSGLWGSDALAGVINIITQQAGSTAGQDVQLEAGSFGTIRGTGSFATGTENARVIVAGSYLNTDGTNISREGSEDDGASHSTAMAHFTWDPIDRSVGFKILARYADADSQFDAVDFVSTGLPTDDDRSTKTGFSLISATGHWTPTASPWKHELKASLLSSDTESLVSDVSIGSTAMNKYALSLVSSVALGSDNSPLKQNLTVAINHEGREFRQLGMATPFGDPNQTQEMDTTGAVLEYRSQTPDHWSLSASLRYDLSSNFEDVTTYRATTSYRLPHGSSRLHASMGTGQKSPTFIERYGFFADTFIGNPELKPENSTGWEFGIDQQVSRKAHLDLTYFNDRLKDEINGFVFDPTLGVFTAENEFGISHRQGAELDFQAALAEHVHLGVTYTYINATQPGDTGGNDEELRRPRHLANTRLSYSLKQIPLKLLFNVSFVGSQVDLFFPPFPQPSERVRLDSYLLTDISARYRIGESVELLARVENALDEHYEDVYGFATPGISTYLGVRILHGSAGRD